MERNGLFHGRVDGCLGQGQATPPDIHGTGIPKSGGGKLLEGRPQEHRADGSVDFFTSPTQDSALEKL